MIDKRRLFLYYRFLILGWTAIAAVHSETIVIRPGLAFINEGTVRLINQKWIVCFDVSLDVYYSQLESLQTELLYLNHTVNRKFIRSSDSAHLEDTVSKFMHREIGIMDSQIQTVRQRLEDVKVLFTPIKRKPRNVDDKSRRVKRGLINGVGRVLSSLFGLVDDQDLRKIQTKLQISRNQDLLFNHMFKEQDTMINITHSQVTKHQEAIQQLGVLAASLTTHIEQLKIYMDHGVNQIYVNLCTFNEISSNFRLLVHHLLQLAT